jgi:peptidoglycan/xylan/chitin deacetylase (PgdA/CDA1 family)
MFHQTSMSQARPMVSPLTQVTLCARDLPRCGRLSWAEGLTVKLPAAVAASLQGGVDTPTAALRQAADDLRLRRAFLEAPPASGRLPVSYRTLWGPARRAIAGVIGRVQRQRQSAWADFPGWPVDLSADVLADLAGSNLVRTWYGTGGQSEAPLTPVLLTHDIDSPEGLQNLIDLFLPIEEAAGARSASYIVPCAWPLDEPLIAEAAARGHETGVHGYDHANRTPFAPEPERRKRLAAGRAFGDRFSAQGYRAPSLVRTHALLDGLAPLYRYDSSIPTSGGPFPVANNGCASARPWLIRGGLWEIPLSMPRDGSLRFLGHSPRAIADLWLASADLIARSSGVVTLLTHCERGFSGNPAMLDAYRRFVSDIAADGRFVFMRPANLVDSLETNRRETQRLATQLLETKHFDMLASRQTMSPGDQR